MTLEEYLAWQGTQLDLHELVDGVPVRLPPERQASARLGRATLAALEAYGSEGGRRWLKAPDPRLGGRIPADLA